MALRVLLADESSTIKKVIQLALQDFAVQVKTVNVGVDALEVAKGFKPDIVLADVLLQKKSGYDVCLEIKKDPNLSKTPVILMWSGFLELDQQQFENSKADDKLEKPFTVETLRGLVTKYVPRLSGQQLTQFITLPSSVTQFKIEPERFDTSPAKPTGDSKAPQNAASAVTPIKPAAESGAWSLDAFGDIDKHMADETMSHVKLDLVKDKDEDADDFAQISLTMEKRQSPTTNVSAADHNDSWMSQDLSQFRIETAEEDEDELPIEFEPKEEFVSQRTSLSIPSKESTVSAKSSTIPQLTAEQIENILRSQSKEIIEAVVWKVVPELAGQIIRQELDRLLREET